MNKSSHQSNICTIHLNPWSLYTPYWGTWCFYALFIAYPVTKRRLTCVLVILCIHTYRASQNKGVQIGKKGCVAVKLIIHPYII